MDAETILKEDAERKADLGTFHPTADKWLAEIDRRLADDDGIGAEAAHQALADLVDEYRDLFGLNAAAHRSAVED